MTQRYTKHGIHAEVDESGELFLNATNARLSESAAFELVEWIAERYEEHFIEKRRVLEFLREQDSAALPVADGQRLLVTSDNIHAVAGSLREEVSFLNGERFFLKTGFGDNPDFKVEVRPGDRIEKLSDGKFQVWAAVADENPPTVQEQADADAGNDEAYQAGEAVALETLLHTPLEELVPKQGLDDVKLTPPPLKGQGSSAEAWRIYAAAVTSSPLESWSALKATDIQATLRSEGVIS